MLCKAYSVRTTQTGVSPSASSSHIACGVNTCKALSFVNITDDTYKAWFSPLDLSPRSTTDRICRRSPHFHSPSSHPLHTFSPRFIQSFTDSSTLKQARRLQPTSLYHHLHLQTPSLPPPSPTTTFTYHNPHPTQPSPPTFVTIIVRCGFQDYQHDDSEFT